MNKWINPYYLKTEEEWNKHMHSLSVDFQSRITYMTEKERH